MNKRKPIVAGLLALGLSAVSSASFAAAGDDYVWGTASPLVIKDLGNSNLGVTYSDQELGLYHQVPDQGSNSGQKIMLTGSVWRIVEGSVTNRKFKAASVRAMANAAREGSHMTGDASVRILIMDQVVWEDTKAYDVTTWAGSEASIDKKQKVFDLQLDSEPIGLSLGIVSVNFVGHIRGSAAFGLTSLSDFNSNNGRHGRAQSSVTGTARVDAFGSGTLAVPILASLSFFTDFNLIKLESPGVGVATWDYTTARSVAERNQYSAVGATGLTGETLGGTFGVRAKLLSLFTVEEKKLAEWRGIKLFEDIERREIANDVGAYR